MWKHIPSPAIGGVWWCPSFFLSPLVPIVCFAFWQEGSAVGLPSFISQWAQQCLQGILHPPYHQAGVSPPRRFRGEGAPPLALVWVVLGLFPWMVSSGTALCHPKTNQRFFLLIGKPRTSSISYVPASYEVSRSVTGSREGRQFGFCFPAVSFWNCTELLAEQECIWCGGRPCCIHRNPGGRKPMTYKPLW